MNGGRPLALILATLAGCVALASMWLHLAGGQASLPTEVVEGAVLQQDCVDDVSVKDVGIYDSDYDLDEPPDYASDAQIVIYYDVTNSSCRNVTVTVELKGSVTGADIHNTDETDDMACLEGCTINTDDNILYGNVGWDLGKHPNAQGEKVVATVTVTAPADFDDTDTSNNTATSAQSINIVNKVPDISVKSITPSATTAVIGETVNFTVVVQNDGNADASNDTSLTLDLGADTSALDTATVSALAVGGKSTVTLSWDDTTKATAKGYSVRALAETEGDGNAANDSRTAAVTLEAPAPDVAVKSVTTSKSQAVVGDTVDFTVTLENDGNVAAVTPAVSLFDANGAADAAALSSATANTIAVDDETTVTISWDTDSVAAGEYSLRVDAAITGDVDSTNDSGTATLTLLDPVDVSVSFTTPLAATAVLGSAVSVPFTITNAGKHDTGTVTVSLYVTQSGEERGKPTTTTTVAALAVSASKSGTLTWDTAAAAVEDYELELVAETAGDIDDTNNSVVADVELRNWLTLKSVSPTSAEAVIGDTVRFTAQVENVGQSAVTAVTVGLYESGVEDPLGSAAIASIAAGGTASASIQWDTAGRDLGQVELFVSAGAEGQDPDPDDTQSANVTIRNPIALSSAAPASVDNIAGTTVSINVRVSNESIAEASSVTVGLYVGDAKTPSVSSSLAAIPSGGTGSAVLEWDTAGVESGKHALRIVASAAGYGADANDERSLDVTLRAPVVNVGLTGATINRNVAAIGQTLDVVATVANRGEAAVAVPVKLYLSGSAKQTTPAAAATSPLIQPESSASVTLQWGSTGESVGTHTLRVAADLTGDTTANDNERNLNVELFNSAFDDTGDRNTCAEDVQVKVGQIRDLSGQLRSPPDYQVGESLKIAYTVYNYSCATDVTLALTMTGPNDKPISDASAPCFPNCAVPFVGRADGEVAWLIPTLPALSDGTVTAVVSSPDSFTDVNTGNDTAASTDKVNIVDPADVVLYLGSRDSGKGKVRGTLAKPEFGEVDVRLASVRPARTVLPFADDTVAVTVVVANDGDAPEPAAVTFLWKQRTLCLSPNCSRRVVIHPGQTKTEILQLPVDDLPHSVDHTIEVALTAAVDLSRDNNTASIEIRRQAPLVDVDIEDVAVSPDVLMLGDNATVSLTVRNKSEIDLPLSLELYVDDAAEPIATQTIDELASDGQSAESIAWRVPASARMLGQHTLRLIASSDDFGAIATVDSQVTLHIDAEIVRIKASPTETAMRGEEVAIEVEVQNNGPATVNVPITLQFPSETKYPETRSPRVPAESTGKAHFTWKTRNYAVGDQTLTATVPEQHNIATGETSMKLPFRVSPLAVTATIVDVSIHPTAPMAGEPVSIAVTVRNDGPVATRIPITLHFPPGGRQPDRRHPHLSPGETGTVIFEWRTGNYRPGTHRFLTEVTAVNSPQRHFTVDLLPPVENAVIVGMGTYPAGTAMVGEPVEVWIDVRNDGPVAINVPVRLTFPSTSKRLDTRSPRVGASETTRVSFVWKTSNYEAGVHTLHAAILLDDNVTVGQTSGELRFVLTPLVVTATILDVAVSPEFPRVGELVSITVSVRNDGRIPVNIPVTLHFPSEDKQLETRGPRIDVGATGAASFTWRTSHHRPGPHAFVVEVAGDTPSTHQFTVELLPPIVDVAIVNIGSEPAGTAVRGQAVRIWVDVTNNGPSALNVPVQLAFPSSDKQPERKSPRIEPGETARVDFTWKTANYDPGIHSLTAELLAEYNTTELDTSATIQIRLISPQLIASITDVTWSPDSPVVGEPVAITVTVRNDGRTTSSIPVTLHFPSGDKQPETKRPRVAPGAVGTTSFTWRTSRYEPGDHVFRVRIPGVAGAVRTFEIELRPPEVDFAVVDFKTPDPLHPILKGDWVEITVVVQNQGSYAGRGKVYLLNGADLDTMYEQSATLEPGESRSVEFTWKTLWYPVGEYELLLRVDAEYDTDSDNDVSDRVRLHLLTGRDITVGFGNNVRTAIFGEPTSQAALSVAPWYSNEIRIAGVDRLPIDRTMGPASDSLIGVSPKPTGGNHDPAKMYWQWRSAQISPWECAGFQRTIGESLPRAVVCPRAPALVR